MKTLRKSSTKLRASPGTTQPGLVRVSVVKDLGEMYLTGTRYSYIGEIRVKEVCDREKTMIVMMTILTFLGNNHKIDLSD
jgi:hypothetical protein